MSLHRRAASVIEAALALVLLMTFASIAWYTAIAPAERGIGDDQARRSLLQAAAALELHFDSRGYLPTTAAEALLIEPSLPWVNGPTASAGEISVLGVNTSGGASVELASPGKESCFTLVLDLTPDSRTEAKSSYAYTTSTPSCTASNAGTNPGGSW
jgi:hypothetical protein